VLTKNIDYYLALNSPWAYLGGRKLAEIAARNRATVGVKPVASGEVFSRTGGLPLAQRAPERQAYRLIELERWRKARALPLNLHPKFFPVPEELAACLVVAAGQHGGAPLALANAIGSAIWAEERNIAETGTLSDIARETGHHATDLMAAALDPAVRTQYRALNEEAISRGVFGFPSYIYNDELFWGQDRLEFLEYALEAS